ncbi:hypothetical protein F8388_002484 [Cannabis sativa]|uniref:RRM domain-containing protein n=1 Tax=Cannabis sativa TaxID=3483 RepID=A0A7J6E762_CANSA|nr:hypothetical protein F8388_002484 [Cannabis sativa]
MDVPLTTPHYPNKPISFTATATAGKHLTTSIKPTKFLPLSLKSPPPPSPASDNSTNSLSPLSGNLRRPKTVKTSSPSPKPAPEIPSNPLKNFVTRGRGPTKSVDNSHSVTNKLWLTSKLSPPPPPPPPPQTPAPTSHLQTVEESEEEEDEENGGEGNSDSSRVEFRQEGKIFVGNLPSWIKKNDVSEFFRQFGPIKDVILIKAHEHTERNAGFGFVLYEGSTATNSALKAVEFDGVEFHGRILTVKLDDGRRLKGKREERERWVHGHDGVEYRTKWHEERESSRMEFKKVVETEPENWKAVVESFQRIKKPSRREYGLMVKYYARRGDMHHARETFESMRARGIEPSSHVYSSLIHAYAVGRDMEEALSCVRKMKEEGIEMSLVTYSIIVSGFAKVGNSEAAEYWFKEAKETHTTLNAIIYGNIIYANWWVFSTWLIPLYTLNSSFIQTHNMDRAEALVREMEEAGIDASIDIYHTMMDGYTMNGNEDKCLVVFDRLKCNDDFEIDRLILRITCECGFTPSVISYGCLINLYTKIGKVSKALEVSRKMESVGIKHNMKTYSMLINGFLKLKDWANAFAVFEDVIKDGLKPDVILYNNIIRAFCGMGNMDRAIRTVKEMQKAWHRPTTRTFMPIIHAFARSGDMDKALEIFDMMRMSGCIPTVHTFNALILGLVEKCQMQNVLDFTFSVTLFEKGQITCVRPLMEKAVEILDEMALAGINPNEHTYTTIMNGYAALGDTGKAFGYFTKLRNEGFELDVFIYEALLKACCKAGRMQSALAVTKEMSNQKIPRNTFVYNILIDGWARRGDVWEAADLMQQMTQEGVRPDIHTYTSFISACCKAGDMLRATKTIEEMQAFGVKPNIKTYTTLIHGWARASLPEKALKCFDEMKQAGLQPDRAVYHCLMTSLLSRAAVAESYIYSGILSICREMIESGLTVDMGTAVHWSKCLRKIERGGGELTEGFPEELRHYDIISIKFDFSIVIPKETRPMSLMEPLAMARERLLRRITVGAEMR